MPLDRKIVLLVDDDKEFLAELQDALASSGYIPVPVSCGRDALRVAKRVRPHVILMDLKLGKESGLSVARMIRKNPGTARTPVVMMSGYFGNKGMTRAMRPSNINIYLSKPFGQRMVFQSIQRALNGGVDDHGLRQKKPPDLVNL